MKTIIIIFLASLFSWPLFAQSGGDSTKAAIPKKLEKQIKEKTDPSLKQQRKRKDIFIDKDGDGICDNRASGMSFEKHRKRYQFKNQGGEGKGQQRGRQ